MAESSDERRRRQQREMDERDREKGTSYEEVRDAKGNLHTKRGRGNTLAGMRSQWEGTRKKWNTEEEAFPLHVTPRMIMQMEKLQGHSPFDFSFPPPSEGMIPQEDVLHGLKPGYSTLENLMAEMGLSPKDFLQTNVPPEWRDPQRTRQTPMDEEEFVQRLRGHYAKKK